MSSAKHWDPIGQTTANNAYSSPRRVDRSMIDVPLSPRNHLDLTRMSWNGRPTWMSRKASLFWRAQGGQSFLFRFLSPTRISWNGWLTRMSGKACSLRRVEEDPSTSPGCPGMVSSTQAVAPVNMTTSPGDVIAGPSFTSPWDNMRPHSVRSQFNV